MHRFAISLLCLFAVILTISPLAYGAKKSRALPPKIQVSVHPYPVFAGVDVPQLTGSITDKNSDLTRVNINWGNGTKTSWLDDDGMKNLPIMDALDKSVFYDTPGEYKITITAWDKRKRRASATLKITAVAYDPALEEAACAAHGCEPPDPEPDLGPPSLYPELTT